MTNDTDNIIRSSDSVNYTVNITDTHNIISVIKKWDKEKIINIIFEQGITTTETANLVSGRGVGLDIVNEKVRSRDGEIEVLDPKNVYKIDNENVLYFRQIQTLFVQTYLTIYHKE